MTWSFTVPLDRLGPTGNTRIHWAARSLRCRGVRSAAFAHAHNAHVLQNIPKATQPRSIRLTVQRGCGTFHDVDNLMTALKPLVDGLKDAGLIVDDSPAWLNWQGVPTQERAPISKGYRVTVELSEHLCG